MRCQILFSLKNKINFRLLSATICIVLYRLTIAQILIIPGLKTINRLKYKAKDK